MADNTIQDRVNTICNDLYARGTKPSIRMVLSMMPDISSTSTIHKYFSKWRNELEANEQSLYDQLGFSSDFTQSFMKEITRFSVQAEQRYKDLAQDANEQKEVAVEDLEHSEERLHKQLALLEQGEKEIKELQAELIKVQDNYKTDLAKEREANRVIVQELRQQLSDSTDVNIKLTTSNESLRTEIAKAELKLEGNDLYVKEVKTQNKALLADNKTLNVNIAELSKKIAGYEATLEGNQKLIVNLESGRSSLQSNLERIEGERLTAVNEIVILRKDLETAMTSLSNTKEQLNSETNQLSELKVTLNDQTRNMEKTIAGYEITINANDKLIGQLELTQNRLETANSELLLINQDFENKLTKQIENKPV